ILDARIEVESSFFGAASVVDTIGAGQRIDIFVIEVEIAGERAELRRFRNSSEWIFRRDLRKFQRRLHHAVEAGWGKVTGICARCTLTGKYAHTDGSRSGFLERFDLAEADKRRELIPFAHHAFGSGCAAPHGT